MLSLRSISITSKTLLSTSRLTNSTLFRPQQQQRVKSSFFSTTETGTTDTGTVKFYSVPRAYGFIVSDANETEIFVHRTGIKGAPEDDNMNPILKKGERIKYKIIPRENGEGFTAKDVCFEDGSQIPTYRAEFTERAMANAKSRLGSTVYEILSEGGNEEEMAQKIADAYIKAKQRIESIQKKQANEHSA